LFFSDDQGWRFLAIVLCDLVVLGFTYVATSYALGPMIRFGAIQVPRRLGQIGQLMARSLPLLLLFRTGEQRSSSGPRRRSTP